MPSISCSDLSLRWPDGTSVLTGLDLSLGPGRTGLIGSNGAGKSTLLKIWAGEVEPTGGSVQVDGALAYLPQHLPLQADAQVDEVLGIAGIRLALREVEAGLVDERRLAVIGDDWAVEEHARATLDRLGLGSIGLDRTIATLSGGEAILLGVAARFVLRPDVLLLDEPTNNLDRPRRGYLYEAVENHRGVLVVVSHDRELLERMDRIVELRDGEARVYGGNLTAYDDAVAAEQQAAEQAVKAAQADVRRQQRQRIEAQTKLARRARSGRKSAAQGMPKIVAGERKRKAQQSAGNLGEVREQRLAAAQGRLAAAEESVREPDEVRIDLPETSVPARRVVLACQGLNSAPEMGLWAGDLSFEVRGPERIALVGPNGAGKTTLLDYLVGRRVPGRGSVTVGVDGVGYLAQHLEIADPSRSVLDNVRLAAPRTGDNALRARLARFAFRGDTVDQPAGTLSGGERFRAVLATLLCADPAPQLLVLDEPTNNLDFHSVEQLRHALEAFRGALLVASHDMPFLRDIRIDRWLRLDRDTGLSETRMLTECM